MRKLASVQTIDKLSPIVGADKIEVANILGWHVVVKKGEFSIGDKCVYIEIDSLLPDKPEFEFMRDRKFRVKTIKLRGQVSQGICFPMSILSQKKEYNIDEDVSEEIGVIKYEDDSDIPEETPAQNKKSKSKFLNFMMRYKWFRNIYLKIHPGRKSYGDFPTEYINKTDETRIQSMPSLLEEVKGKLYYATEKLDGMSTTMLAVRNNGIFKKNIDFIVCSRNRIASEGSTYWEIARKFEVEKFLKSYLKEHKEVKYIAIQGEIIGTKIQGNKYKLTGNDFYVFNLEIDGVRQDLNTIEKLLKHSLMKTVFVVNRGIINHTVDQFVEMSRGNSVLCPRNREGIVVRLLYAPSVSFKVINPDFLLENK